MGEDTTKSTVILKHILLLPLSSALRAASCNLLLRPNPVVPKLTPLIIMIIVAPRIGIALAVISVDTARPLISLTRFTPPILMIIKAFIFKGWHIDVTRGYIQE